jgi:hypothetical protein
MSKMSPKKIMEKLSKILDAWRDIAPTESFGGMTLTEFQTEVGKSVTAREEIIELENQVTNKMQGRDSVDAANWEKAQLVVNSVAGNPNFGKNSGLYEAMGYVPTDQKKSGLTRKTKTEEGDNE